MNPWKRRKPIRPVSKRRAQQNKERRCVARQMEGARCAMCNARADDLHEVLSRARGGSITDPENIRPLCRPCHTYITEHPAWAEANGWSKNSWEAAG